MVGKAVFFLGARCKNAILGDTNEHIAHCLIAVRDHPDEVIALLSQLSNTIEDYNQLKNFRPCEPIQSAARMIFLTNTSWGGLYRENRQGSFNVPFGNNGRAFYSVEKIKAASEKLKGAKVIHGDYSSAISKSGTDDLIFVDAPYVTKTASRHFDRYHASRFAWKNQVELGEMLNSRLMRDRKILITCAADPDLYELFKGWDAVEFSKRNSMTAHKSISRNRNEALLISPALHYLVEKLKSKNPIISENLQFEFGYDRGD